MTEASFASLNPALLARKGGAKPAMRPQLGHIPNVAGSGNAAPDEDSLEDLGWNDMGSDEEHEGDLQERPSAEVVQFTPASLKDAEDGLDARDQQDILAKRISHDNDELGDEGGTVAKRGKGAKRRSALERGKRAAFTLRLDAERHLKLRLASTMRGVSAQALVTEALDTLLEGIDELEQLAAKMSKN